jgi:hypothetical protein
LSGLPDEQRQKVIARISQSERRKRWESVSSGGFSEEELRSGVEKMMLCLDRCEQSLASGNFLVNEW